MNIAESHDFMAMSGSDRYADVIAKHRVVVVEVAGHSGIPGSVCNQESLAMSVYVFIAWYAC